MKRDLQSYKGWLWMTGYFVVLILASNHSQGYSLLDRFLDDLGIGSWTKEVEIGGRLHTTSLISLPLLLLCLYQTVRGLKERVPQILFILLIVTGIWTVVYPKITEGIF
ncbi:MULTISPECIES: hypothetical protein [Paenibacillus]|uniref:Uncharacterized protein n=2 Tax=Paenibacillus barengoltzii TaxID=343517 RepID=R9LBG0_9BACL|nr:MULTISPECIES: hypothetical protein [Paenibacillus]EOS56055.1 hypothetical protein C812_02117 [Paenibacillus barengoltzii G22]MDU0331830.1 hypothetical protein [Paenibacillus sp. 3LSP]MEC2343671.1 hypothetical protein [Paenibacillus barengoltzii]SME98864.1 hypothetical protein SAMN02744124_00646 [Paenibacillus barengoltzii J12]SMF59157.1 hypothetical protein SAMN02744102_04058 [Paenibacillus barengoltzii]